MATALNPGLLRTLSTTAFGSYDQTIDFMKQKALLASSAACTCGSTMTWQKSAERKADGYIWRCPRTGCRKKQSIRRQSFFTRSHLSLQTWIKLIYFWATDLPVTKVSLHLDEKECSTKTAIDVYNFLREVCSQKLISMGSFQLGGTGKIVQIDESLFKHKPKV